MSVNQQAQAALDQAKKLADDAAAVKNKSIADAKAVVAAATTPAATTAAAKATTAAAKATTAAAAATTAAATTAAAKATTAAAKKKEEKQSRGKYIYSVFHTIMSIVAIFLSYRCNGCFQWIPFLAALCCPYLYIIYIIIFKNQCFSPSFVEPKCGPEVVYVQAPQYGYMPPPPAFNYPAPAPMPPTLQNP
jgi:hypothetical protein